MVEMNLDQFLELLVETYILGVKTGYKTVSVVPYQEIDTHSLFDKQMLKDTMAKKLKEEAFSKTLLE